MAPGPDDIRVILPRLLPRHDHRQRSTDGQPLMAVGGRVAGAQPVPARLAPAARVPGQPDRSWTRSPVAGSLVSDTAR
jgi:hypothetical protein